MIPSSVTVWGELAFSSSALTNVVLSQGLTSIGSCAFYECNKLGEVTIPSSVTDWGDGAFENSGLTNVVLSEGLTSIGSGAFGGCASLDSVTIPEGVTNIGFIAFGRGGAGAPVEITFPSTLTNQSQFTGCFRDEVSVTFSEKVTNISDNMFANCSDLVSVTIPEGVTNIGKYAFDNCSQLGEVTIPSSVTNLGELAFAYSGLTNVVLSQGLTSIGERAFYWCQDLQTVSIPESVTKIGMEAFYYSSSLTSLTIPEGVTSIGYGAFTYGSLKSVTIPESVTNIGDNAFYGCPLTSVTIPKGVTSIGNGVFYACNIEKLTIPDGVTSIGNVAFGSCSNLKSVTIPEGVTNIGDGAFANCRSLETITIPDGILNIGDEVFSSCCSLVSVKIPDGVTNIGWLAFYDCTNLTSVTIPECVASIGTNAFASCDNLATVYCDAGDSARVSNLLANSGFDVSKLTFIEPQVVAENIEKVYDGVPTNFVVTVTDVQEGVTTHVAYSLDGVTYAPESPAFTNVLRDAEGNVLTQKVWYAASADNGTLNVTNFATVAILPRPVEVEVAGHTNVVAFTGAAQSVEGYEVAFEDALYSADWIAFGGTNRVAATAVGKYDMGLKPEDFANTNVNFAVTFGVTDGWLEIILKSGVVCTETIDGVEWTYTVMDDESASIGSASEGKTAVSPTTDGEIKVPATIGGLSVVRVDNDAFKACADITKVTIPVSVTNIGANAFQGCSSLERVTYLGNGPAFVGSGIYSGTSSNLITEVKYESSGWIAEGETTFPETWPNGDADARVIVRSGYNEHSRNTGIYQVVDGIEWLCCGSDLSGHYDHDGCLIPVISREVSGAVVIPSTLNGVTVTQIGMYAFVSCTNITAVTIPDTVTIVGGYAFAGCWSLETVAVPKSVLQIQPQSFSSCSSLSEFNVDEANPNYSSRDGVLYDRAQAVLLACPPAKEGELVIPDGVVEVGYNNTSIFCGSSAPFAHCGLTKVLFPASVTNVVVGFAYCDSLSFVGYKGNAPLTGDYVMVNDVTNMTTYVIAGTRGWDGNPESTAIPATWQDRPLVAVPAQSTVTFDLGGHATRTGGGELTQTVAAFDAAVAPEIAANAGYTFTGWSDSFDCVISNMTIYAQYDYETPTNGVYTEVVDGIEWTYTIKDGKAMVGTAKSDYVDPGEEPEFDRHAIPVSAAGDIVIPSELGGCPVTKIGTFAFGGCDSLVSVVVPESVVEIAEGVFYDCRSLTSVSMPDGIAWLGHDGRYMFTGCTALASVKIPDGIGCIGYGAFGACAALTAVEIPDSVTNIYQRAFDGCESLAAVIISKSVEAIGYQAFDRCASLANFYCEVGDSARIRSLMEASGHDVSGITFEEPHTVVGHIEKVYDGTPTNFVVSVAGVPEGVTTHVAYSLDGVTYAPESPAFTDVLRDAEGNVLTQKVWYVASADNGTLNVTNFATVAVLPRPVEVEVTGHTNTVAFTGEPQSVEGYEQTFEDELYNADWIEFSGTNRVEATAVGKYDMGLKPGDFANTNANFAVTFGVTDGWLEITARTDGTYTDTIDGIDWTYVIQDGLAWVGGGTWRETAVPMTTAGDIDIPATLGGCSVVGVNSEAFSRCSRLTSVTVPEGVMFIGYNAFEECSSLTDVDLPQGLAEIGDYAFDMCSALLSVDIPEGVAYVGMHAFDCCFSLVRVEIPASVTSIGYAAFGNCRSLEEFVVDPNNECFAVWNGLLCDKTGSTVVLCPNGLQGAVTVPQGVKTISNGAFDSCYRMTAISLPAGLENIADSAFYFCSNLTSVVIPNGVTNLGWRAFANCSSLREVELSSGLSRIENQTFSSCSALTSVNIPEGVEFIDGQAFGGCKSLASVTVPASVTEIVNRAFSGCSSLSDVVVDSGNPRYVAENGLLCDVETMAVVAGFGGLRGEVVVPGEMLSISEWAFEECRGVTSLVLSSGVESVGSSAFWSCTNLVSVAIPNSVTYVGHMAFGGCKALKTVYVEPGDIERVRTMLADSQLDIAGLSFVETALPLPDGSYEETVDGVDWSFVISDGEVAIGGGSNKKTAVPTSTVGRVTVPAQLGGRPVTSIGRSAFDGCKGVTEVILPDGLLEVGSTAFRGCTSLVSVHMPTSLVRIATSAFSGCSSLADAALPEGLATIGNFAFSFCTSLSAVTVPSSVTSLGTSAFEGCRSLETVRFKGNVPKGLASSMILDRAVRVFYPKAFETSYSVFVPKEIFAGYSDTKGLLMVNAIGGASVTVSDTWVSEEIAGRYGRGKVAEFKRKYGSDLAGAMYRATGKFAGDGRALTVLDDFVAGTDPTDEKSVFTASIAVGADGKPIVTWSPDLNDNGAKSVRTYRVMGAKELGSGWTEVPEGGEDQFRYFKVDVSLPGVPSAEPVR